MSYDLHVWCVQQPDAASTGTLAEGKSWLVNVTSSACMAEDVPDEVLEQLPGIQHRVDVSLQPIHAPQAGKRAAWKIARVIAKSSHGVIENPQEQTVELPSGVKRFTPIKHESGTRASMLELSWWFDHARFTEREYLEHFLDVLKRSLPEAMPRRYGLFEPPQHEYAKAGREHLVEFLAANLTDTIVWYAHRPVLHVFINIGREPGWGVRFGKDTYFCNRFAIALDSAALAQPGWHEGLRHAWRTLSRELRPFFGDVRTLHGYIASGRSFWSNSQTEHHPVRGGMWRGIPPRLGNAAVVGDRYLDVWPQLRGRTEVDGGLAFISTSDWRTDDDAGDLVGGVPESFAIGFMPRRKLLEGGGSTDEWFEGYPNVFPFPRPNA